LAKIVNNLRFCIRQARHGKDLLGWQMKGLCPLGELLRLAVDALEAKRLESNSQGFLQ
jgi:hypothetical protein